MMDTPLLHRPAHVKVEAEVVPRVKVLSAGDMAVGKSCLIKRYCENRFVPKYISTIGVDYGVKRVTLDPPTTTDVKVNFWDLAGHPTFFDVRNEFYKDTQGMILVFDVGSRKSFESLESWLKEAANFGAVNPILVLCANKIDAPKRVVTEKEARSWATSRGFLYFETSASSGENVVAMFQTLFQKILESMNTPTLDDQEDEEYTHDFYYSKSWAVAVGICSVFPALCVSVMLCKHTSRAINTLHKIGLCLSIQLILVNVIFATIHLEVGYALHTLCVATPPSNDGLKAYDQSFCCSRDNLAACLAALGTNQTEDVRLCDSITLKGEATSNVIYEKVGNSTVTVKLTYSNKSVLCEKLVPEILGISVAELVVVMVIFIFVAVNMSVCTPAPEMVELHRKRGRP